MIAKIGVYNCEESLFEPGIQQEGKLGSTWQPELHIGTVFLHDCGVVQRKKLIHQDMLEVLLCPVQLNAFWLVMAGRNTILMAFSSSLMSLRCKAHTHAGSKNDT